MPRLRHFTRSLLSGYLLMGANTLFVFLSMPLALQFLSPAEFGLWAVTTRVAGYIALVEFGVSGAISRILVDYKDAKDGPGYGQTILTAVFAGIAQGVLVLLAGIAAASLLGAVLNVPVEFESQFWWLTVGQSGVLALTFVLRIFPLILAAHQRYDIANYSQAISFFISLAVMWFSFRAGCGIFSLLWGQFAATICATTATVIACWRLPVWPHRGCWVAPTWSKFREVLSLSNDIFLFVIGGQLINASQVLLVTRFLGLEASAIWYACTQTFTLLQQMIFRLFDYSVAALAEMMVRNERERLFQRFRSLILISASASVFAAVFFVLCNQPFVRWWTGGKVGWSATNDILLAIWLVVTVLVHSHIGLAGQTKQFRFMRYVYFCEGLFFVALAAISLSRAQFPAMIVASIISTLLFSFPYGIWRTSRYFGVSWTEVTVGWNRPALRLFAMLVPLGVSLYYLTRGWAPVPQLAVNGSVAATLGVWLFVRWGLNEEIRKEMRLRVSRYWSAILG